MRQLADHTNMSQATATTIMDRLESRQLVQRIRSETDKRKVHATLTDAGRALLAQAPTPLQERFIQRFQALEVWEQTLLLSSLQRISAMMNADEIDAAPVLASGPSPRSGHKKSSHRELFLWLGEWDYSSRLMPILETPSWAAKVRIARMRSLSRSWATRLSSSTWNSSSASMYSCS